MTLIRFRLGLDRLEPSEPVQFTLAELEATIAAEEALATGTLTDEERAQAEAVVAAYREKAAKARALASPGERALADQIAVMDAQEREEKAARRVAALGLPAGAERA